MEQLKKENQNGCFEEKIGKVTLNYAFYPGEDKYSDGGIEDEMLALAQEYGDAPMDAVIAQKKSWPILYHFSHVRENIIEWLPLRGDERVLEIGAGLGAITGALTRKAGQVTCIDLSRKRSLVNAHRHKNCENLRILVGNFQDVEENLKETYDLITLIGVFEYAQFSIQSEDPFVDYLKRIRRHLAPGGKLVIAIENRLGLKYWAGATEDHTGLYFEGLEGYPKTDYVRTFSKPELEKVLNTAGFTKHSFYYPYPDYKLPERIYSDTYLPGKGELNQNTQNFDRERMRLFQEELVYDSLLEAGQFPQFSNSFLVFAEDPKNTSEPESSDACAPENEKFSNERAREFSVLTEIVCEKGERFVRKLPAFFEAKKHVYDMYQRYIWLKEELAGTGLRVNPAVLEPVLLPVQGCLKKEQEASQQNLHAVRVPFSAGQTLEQRLDQLLEKGKEKELKQEIAAYFALFSKAELPFQETPEFKRIFGTVNFETQPVCRRISDIDMVFSNVMETKDGPELIDYEWTFDFPIPVKFLQYRCLHYYVHGAKRRAGLSVADLLAHFGITKK